MTPSFQAFGKQVLRQGEHYADANSNAGAEAIATALNAWAREAEPAIETVNLIDSLRREEMWAVMIHHDNPDEGPQCSITCEGEWVEGLPNENGLYPIKQFFGDSILDCLREAHTEMITWRAAQ